MNNTIKTTTLIAVGVIGGAFLQSVTFAQEVGNPVITKLDSKTAIAVQPVSTTLNIDSLKEEINNIKLSKDSLNLSCSQQVDYYNSKLDAVRAKIQSLKDLGIE